MDIDFLIFDKDNRKVNVRGIVEDRDGGKLFTYENRYGRFTVTIDNRFEDTILSGKFVKMVDCYLQDDGVKDFIVENGLELNKIFERDGYNLYINAYGENSWL